jgi:hypothetical protein
VVDQKTRTNGFPACAARSAAGVAASKGSRAAGGDGGSGTRHRGERQREREHGASDDRAHGTASTRSGLSRVFQNARNRSPDTSSWGRPLGPAVEASSCSDQVSPASLDVAARSLVRSPSNSFQAIAR